MKTICVEGVNHGLFICIFIFKCVGIRLGSKKFIFRYEAFSGHEFRCFMN